MEAGKSPSPLVSVIVPAYNMERYVAETLDSIRKSNYPHWEAIVVDDGSKDETFERARRHVEGDDRFRVIRQENRGVSAARNHALRLSQGRYILPVDADDLITPDFIARAVEAMEAHPEAKAVTCQGEFFEGRTGRWNLPPFNRSKLALDNMLSNTSLYRREEALRVGGYDEEIPAREDWEFWISMLKEEGEVIHLPEVGFYYRVRAGSRRFSDRKRKAEVVAYLNRKHADFFERELQGPLYTQRSHSLKINKLRNLFISREVTRCKRGSLRYWISALPRLKEGALKIGEENFTLQRTKWQLRSQKSPLETLAQEQVVGLCRERLLGLWERHNLLLSPR